MEGGARVHAFGDCELDEGLYALRRGGHPVPLEPRVFDVLLYLLLHRERVVTKDELLDTLWPGEAVSDSVLPRCVAVARRAVGDDRSRQAVIRTLHGRGYRFVAEVRERAPTGPPRASPSSGSGPDVSGPLVGRDASLTRLREGLEEALAGRGHVLLLAGEPGIGKTRLLQAMAAEARERGARVLAGRCEEGEGAPAFWPWSQVLREGVSGLARRRLLAELGDAAAVLGELVPELRRGSAPLRSAAGGEEQERFRFFEAATALMARLSDAQPLVITLDDLHWADGDSLELFRFLATSLRQRSILLLGSYRDVEVRREHALARMLGTLAREPHCERVALRGLDARGVAVLLGLGLGAEPPPALVERIAGLTDGHPFFVQEIAALLAEGGADATLEQDELALPQGVRDAIGRRLASLSPECNELLRTASVVGRELRVALLEAVVGRSGEAVLELLGEALAAHVLVEVPERIGTFSFRHELVRQTLYEELSVPRRVALHAAVGRALASQWGEREDAPSAELARHFLAGAPACGVEPAILWSERAARRAHALCAYEEAARHLGRALEALDYGDPGAAAERARLLVLRGQELWAAGRREEARPPLSEAAELARRCGRSDLLARAAVAYRGLGEMGMPADARTLALLQEATDALGDEHPVLRAQLLWQQTGTPPWSTAMATRRALADEAADLAAATDDRDAWRAAIGARYWAALGPDRLDERLAVARDALALGERWNDRQLNALGHEIAVGAHLLRGNLEAVDRHVAAYRRAAEELRQPVFRFIAGMIDASQASNRGAFDEAERRAREVEARDGACVPYAAPLIRGFDLWMRFQRGLATAPGEATRAELQGLPEGGALGHALDVSARSDAVEARRELAALAQEGFAFERDESWLVAVALLALQAARLGAAEEAALLHRLLLPFEDLAIAHDLLRGAAGSAQSVLGVLALTAGSTEEAVGRFEQALAWETAAGLRPARVRSGIGLAWALHRRGRQQDVRAGEMALREAYSEAGALGMAWPPELLPLPPGGG